MEFSDIPSAVCCVVEKGVRNLLLYRVGQGIEVFGGSWCEYNCFQGTGLALEFRCARVSMSREGCDLSALEQEIPLRHWQLGGGREGEQHPAESVACRFNPACTDHALFVG